MEPTERVGRPRGRPRVGSTGVFVTLKPDQLAALDAFAASELDKPSRPEAVRRLVAKGLSGLGGGRTGQLKE